MFTAWRETDLYNINEPKRFFLARYVVPWVTLHNAKIYISILSMYGSLHSYTCVYINFLLLRGV